jgi:hypothetical protein
MSLRRIATEVVDILQIYHAGWAGYFGVAVFGALVVLGVTFPAKPAWIGGSLAIIALLIVLREDLKEQQRKQNNKKQ